jgi:signal transduction histidine kinase
MFSRISALATRSTLSQRFTLASLVILATGMLAIGAWVAKKIEAGVIDRTGATTALYVDSTVAPLLQELADGETLNSQNAASLNALLHDSPLGQQIVIFKVWNAQGKVLFSTDQAEVGRSFPVEEGLAEALQGHVSAEISDLTQKAENLPEHLPGVQLLEIYSPVRLRGTNRIIAVMEFYQSVAEFQGALMAAQRESWVVFGLVTGLMYLLLTVFVKRASDTIVHQQSDLGQQVALLQELHGRVRGAAARTAALNERFLRRTSAELHDGPVQDIALALFQLDDLNSEYSSEEKQTLIAGGTLGRIADTLRHALREMRAISAGLGVPDLQKLSLPETVTRAAHNHEKRTGSRVALGIGPLPIDVPLPTKITVYRVVQEALNNAFRHAQGRGQSVQLQVEADQLVLNISDQGPGFHSSEDSEETHLGLVGMRERVASLGGALTVTSVPGKGTHVIARLPIYTKEMRV